MTTNKPGSVNQQPLYGCVSCYEGYSWPASDLRVHDGECWCDLCWDERRWEIRDQPCWNDLEPYTPALQAECEKLRKDAERYRYIKKGNRWIVAATQTGAHLDGEVLDDLIDSEMEQQEVSDGCF